MAYEGSSPFDVPGLNRALKLEDLEESHNIYNSLPDDSQQPEILESHIYNIAAIIVRNRAHGLFGIHLAHRHFTIPENTAMLGTNYEEPYCRWARPTENQTIDLRNTHTHIFVLRENGCFHPYEYQTGPVPDLSGVNTAFLLLELADYLKMHNLSTLVGVQVIDLNPAQMLELVLPQGTIMLDISVLNGCAPTRQTGWKFEGEDGNPRVCQANESHGQKATHHEIYNKGDPHPRLENFQDLKHALVEAGILCL